MSLDDRMLGDLGDRERARALAVVPQSESSPFPVTVREMVGMGRYAHLGSWQSVGPRDRAVVDEALERCAVAPLADRQLGELSGGERQRARVARALAQEAPVLLLDEPTAGLDLRYRMELFHLLRELRADGLALIVVTRDLNLAARFADRLHIDNNASPRLLLLFDDDDPARRRSRPALAPSSPPGPLRRPAPSGGEAHA